MFFLFEANKKRLSGNWKKVENGVNHDSRLLLKKTFRKFILKIWAFYWIRNDIEIVRIITYFQIVHICAFYRTSLFIYRFRKQVQKWKLEHLISVVAAIGTWISFMTSLSVLDICSDDSLHYSRPYFRFAYANN